MTKINGYNKKYERKKKAKTNINIKNKGHHIRKTLHIKKQCYSLQLTLTINSNSKSL